MSLRGRCFGAVGRQWKALGAVVRSRPKYSPPIKTRALNPGWGDLGALLQEARDLGFVFCMDVLSPGDIVHTGHKIFKEGGEMVKNFGTVHA